MVVKIISFCGGVACETETPTLVDSSGLGRGGAGAGNGMTALLRRVEQVIHSSTRPEQQSCNGDVHGML